MDFRKSGEERGGVDSDRWWAVVMAEEDELEDDELEDDELDGTLIPGLSAMTRLAQLSCRGFKMCKLCFVSSLRSSYAVVFVSSCILVGTLCSVP